MKTAADKDHDAAARWAIRLDTAPLDGAEQAELDAWLDADERRHGALLRAEAVLAYLDRGRALADNPSLDSDVKQRRFPGYRAMLAASLAALVVTGVLGYTSLGPRPVEFQTAIGEIRRVPLADGSVASINTDSRLQVVMRDKRREVTLNGGEAWFRVAHDKTRPFVVAAGDIRVQAVGTAFSVRRREGGADVLVTEGVVETWVVGHEKERKRIAAGSRSFVADGAPTIQVVPAGEDIDRALAWRSGDLVLNGQSLAYAASELNRYNHRKLVVDDAALGRETIVGYFRTEQPEKFARAAGAMFGARVEIEGDTIRLTR